MRRPHQACVCAVPVLQARAPPCLRTCRLGANVKITNSVLQDNVVVGDGCTIQNSILCAGAVVKERATLKDCQVGAGFTVTGGQDYNGDVLSHKPAVPVT